MATNEHDGRDPIAWLPEEWAAWLTAQGQRPFRAMQVFRWIHIRGVMDPQGMTDLARELRERLAQIPLRAPAVLDDVRVASDGTQKALVRLGEGGTVETVLIPPASLDDADRAEADEVEASLAEEVTTGAPRRVTQCISSQVGCAMACGFCASGVAGLKRNLTAAEIVSQVLLGRARLGEGEALRNVVLMGMGEPLHNYGNVERALRLLTHREGIGLSTRRVTVSTSGLVPEIERLGRDFRGHIGLAISLHAPDDALRSQLMPVNRKYPIAELVAALRRYPLPPRRRITIEYTLLDGVNDGDAEARALVRVLRGIPVKVNLIPMNPVEGQPFAASSPARVTAFQDRVRAAGLSVFVRKRRGDDIDAACGQLALRGGVPRRPAVVPADRLVARDPA